MPSLPVYGSTSYPSDVSKRLRTRTRNRQAFIHKWFDKLLGRADEWIEKATGKGPSAAAGAVSMGGDTYQMTIQDARDPCAVVAQIEAWAARQSRAKKLTYATPTVRGAR